MFSQTRNFTAIVFTDANMYVRDFIGVTRRLKATVPDRRVWLPAPACVIVAVCFRKALKDAHGALKGAKQPARPCGPLLLTIDSGSPVMNSASPSTWGNETRTQNACASVPKRIVSYSYTVIVTCIVLYDVPINVAYKTLSKYFIQVLSFVTMVHVTQTATRVSPNYTLHSQN